MEMQNTKDTGKVASGLQSQLYPLALSFYPFVP